MKEEVILIDKSNKKIGTAEKLKAHQVGQRHRAFSLFIFNQGGELLIQKRAKNKYHSAGLWSNTVCGHPRPKENYIQAAHRRLKEEMGFDCKLKKIFCFDYNVKLANGLVENEYDCVYTGRYDEKIKPNPKEVAAYKYIGLEKLEKDIRLQPSRYSVWLKIVLPKIK